jgi:tRNA-dependent cyclodipeptide synthase
MTELAAIKQAMRNGATIVERLQRLIPTWGIDGVAILSARSLYEDASFENRLSRFEREYTANNNLRMLIDSAVDEFLLRKHPDTTPDNNILSHCVAYQLEELVLFELLAETNYRTIVYPGAHLPVMRGIVSGQVKRVSDALETMTLVEVRIFGGRKP